MTQRTLLIAFLVCLVATSAWAQARTEPAGEGPKPAMIVDGRAIAPAAWAKGLRGETVTLDGVEMMWIGKAAKEAGGSATIETTPGGKMLHVRSGIRTMDFVVMQPGEFWRHPWVRDLIPVAQLQPMPYWPYEEANIPADAPHRVTWKRPYLDWKPDEAWLLLNLEPPQEVEEAAVPLDEALSDEELEAAYEEAMDRLEAELEEEAAGPAETGGPGGPGMGPGMEPGGPGGGPGGPGMEPGMGPEPI